MKLVKAYLLGFLGLMLAILTPICVLAIVDRVFFGDNWTYPPPKGELTYYLIPILMLVLIFFSARHYLFRYLIPYYARCRILKVGDKPNTEQWIRWVETSLFRARRDLEALEAYHSDLAEQIGAADAASPRR